MVQLRLAGAGNFRREVGLADDCDRVGRLTFDMRRLDIPDQNAIVGAVSREQALIFFVENGAIDRRDLIGPYRCV